MPARPCLTAERCPRHPTCPERWVDDDLQPGARTGIVLGEHHADGARRDRVDFTGSPPSSRQTASAPRSVAATAGTWLSLTFAASLLPTVPMRKPLKPSSSDTAPARPLISLSLRTSTVVCSGGVGDLGGLPLILILEQADNPLLDLAGSTRTTDCIPSSLQPSSASTGMVAKATLPPPASAAA